MSVTNIKRKHNLNFPFSRYKDRSFRFCNNKFKDECEEQNIFVCQRDKSLDFCSELLITENKTEVYVCYIIVNYYVRYIESIWSQSAAEYRE